MNNLTDSWLFSSISRKQKIKTQYQKDEQFYFNKQATGMLVRASDLKHYGGKPSSKSYVIKSFRLNKRKIHKASYTVCPDNKFSAFRSAQLLGTGFFIKPGLVATAAHVLYPSFERLKLEDIRFVCGYYTREKKSFKYRLVIPKSQVFKPKISELKDFKLTSIKQDWALIPMEPVQANSTFEPAIITNHMEAVELNQEVYSFGHGLGLPILSDDGLIHVNNPQKSFFKCKLELFSGNSGSPIFDAKTHALVGMLIRGQQDFQVVSHVHEGQNHRCLEISLYSDNFEGEECQRISYLVNASKNY